jgi:uncharacterized membrane protein
MVIAVCVAVLALVVVPVLRVTSAIQTAGHHASVKGRASDRRYAAIAALVLVALTTSLWLGRA